MPTRSGFLREEFKMLKFTVEFEVDARWIADGFDLTDERAGTMLEQALPFANSETEIRAKVVKRPSKAAIKRAIASVD